MDPSKILELPPKVLATIPAMPPPPGVKSNFDNPETLSPMAIGIISLFLGFMILVVALRMYARFPFKKAGLDDWMAVLAGLATTGLAGLIIYEFDQNWIGPYKWDVRLEVMLSATFTRVITGIIMMTSVAGFFAKTSVLLFVLRIFPRRASPKTAWLIIAGIVLNTVAFIALILTTGINCVPRPSAPQSIPASCTGESQRAIGLASSSVNAALDIYVLAVALPALWALQMAKRKKLGVVGVFAMGLLTCSISITILVYRTKIDSSGDRHRTEVPATIFSILEPIFAVICACLPTLPAVWTKFSTQTQGGSSIRNLLSRLRTTGSFSQSHHNTEFEKGGFELRGRSLDDSVKNLRHEDDTYSSDTERVRKVQRDVESPAFTGS